MEISASEACLAHLAFQVRSDHDTAPSQRRAGARLPLESSSDRYRGSMTEGARRGDEKPPVKWLTAAEVDSWLSVVRLMTWLPWSIDQQLQRDSNLGMVEYQVLAMLSNRPEWTMRMSSLAEVTNASLSRLSHLVKRLEGRGLVRREPDPSDGRFTNAILTDEASRPSPTPHPGTWPMCDRSSSTSCRPSNCAASAWPPTASCRASTPLASTNPRRPRPPPRLARSYCMDAGAMQL